MFDVYMAKDVLWMNRGSERAARSDQHGRAQLHVTGPIHVSVVAYTSLAVRATHVAGPPCDVWFNDINFAGHVAPNQATEPFILIPGFRSVVVPTGSTVLFEIEETNEPVYPFSALTAVAYGDNVYDVVGPLAKTARKYHIPLYGSRFGQPAYEFEKSDYWRIKMGSVFPSELPASTWVGVVDAADVLFQDSAFSLVDKLNKTGKPVVYSCERYCFPAAAYADDATWAHENLIAGYNPAGNAMYADAGIWFCRYEDFDRHSRRLRDVMNLRHPDWLRLRSASAPMIYTNDMLRAQWLRNDTDIAYDLDYHITYTMSDVAEGHTKDVQCDGRRIISPFGTVPSLVHAPGGAKVLLPQLTEVILR